MHALDRSGEGGRRRVAGALLAALPLLLLAPDASAAEVHVDAGRLVLVGERSEAVNVRIDPSDSAEVRIRIQGSAPDAGPGCILLPDPDFLLEFAVACSGVTAKVEVTTGDLADAVTVESPGGIPVHINSGGENDFLVVNGESNDSVDAGAGDDVVAVGAGDARLTGGEGADYLVGDFVPHEAGGVIVEPGANGAGSDVLNGGPGADRLVPGPGADVIAGGTGTDTVDYAGRAESVSVSVGNGAEDGEGEEGDDVHGDVENIVTGRSNDVVVGSPEPESIATGAGDDVIRPGPGQDHIDSGADADRIDAADGEPDTLDCGDGSLLRKDPRSTSDALFQLVRHPSSVADRGRGCPYRFMGFAR